MDLTQILTTYKDAGVAGVFLLLYCVTVWKFYNALIDQKKEIVEMTGKYATALDQSIVAVNRSTVTMDNVAKSIEQSRTQTNEVIAYIKGRDDGRTGR